MDFDVIVLGAGIVGVSSALHLQDRGLRVALVDRREPGEETSHGNAGLIERSSVVPYAFPRRLGTLLRYARNRSVDLYWDYRALPAYAGWLARFWRESSPQRLAAAARDLLPLVEASVVEHDALLARTDAQPLVHDGGWIEAFRSPALFDAEARVQQRVADAHGLRMTVLDARALRDREPGVSDAFCGAFHWQDPKTVSSPGGLTKAYARLFERDGGTFVLGDATTLAQVDDGWRVGTAHGPISARSAVVALGPWSDHVFAPLGYRIPLRAKRGYHMHYQPTRTPLTVPVCDTEEGFVVAPMDGGRLRLTTGVEIALRGAPPTGVQLARAEPLARDAFGIGERLDPEPWLGMRPCTPDMRPVIGPAPRHRHLWFAFGHCHHGLTLGPATGRLLAEMMTGAPTYIDPHPYRPARFG
ncbi:amino acid dehydrogenase [Burkholderia stabilis]|uniref:NAD(P)/FAD-dependent oxidoreductase n=1 Tax=Burkholderia stabilis TaxID=95485 RepID=UPI0008517CD1|nr:FAD-binding oxidoreductase [Burkholderia stabilis]AOR67484.1 amino acid dehydrogenase [Burkholderia stabilis]HDR9495954.1 FAD-binding oxidoreductase [Burkholderia stabilis]HDR9527846.1 FAD-binding oxidoreductase [Burkholderia stabilis]HDR9534589.1 FAD-binding oxidoreductase [Burkholderia stabilis]HDR9539342.1 FAD-binding oxidoreductase [Burkholderia stabilis]